MSHCKHECIHRVWKFTGLDISNAAHLGVYIKEITQANMGGLWVHFTGPANAVEKFEKYLLEKHA